MSARPRPSLPGFLKRPIASGGHFGTVRAATAALHTICEEGRCPNRAECYASGTATFLIMGPSCTRRCAYCSVAKGAPAPLDANEPARVAESVHALGLSYAVVTSVTRDDLPDGGIAHFVRTVHAIRGRVPGCEVEVLVPDFMNVPDALDALDALFAAGIAVFNHNVETVPRLFPAIRPGADYEHSLELLARAARRKRGSGFAVKSGFMVGLGESDEEVHDVLRDLAGAGVDVVTVGQYFRPSRAHLPPSRYVEPARFDEYERWGRALGIARVVAGPYVRSSYHARETRAAVSGAKG